jgi:hypothetical protein
MLQLRRDRVSASDILGVFVPNISPVITKPIAPILVKVAGEVTVPATAVVNLGELSDSTHSPERDH